MPTPTPTCEWCDRIATTWVTVTPKDDSYATETFPECDKHAGEDEGEQDEPMPVTVTKRPITQED